MSRFVVVDDDKSVRNVLVRIIEQNGLGEVVAEAENGLQGEEIILNNKPDIAVVDLLLPQQDGIAIVRKIKSLNIKCVFVMLSQVSAKDMIGKAYEAGIEFYISKPINAMEVVNVIKKVKENLTLKKLFNTIENTASSFKMSSNAIAAVSPDSFKRILDKILADLGILGDLGSKDIINICMLLMNDRNLYDNLEEIQLNDFLKVIQSKYLTENVNMKGDVKAIEMRVRRAVSKAMKNIASMGIEDFANEKFNIYSTSLFDYTDIKAEMDALRGKKGVSGKVNLKSFFRRLMVMIEHNI
ncbi:MAG: response regulator [Bacillota bacterium]